MGCCGESESEPSDKEEPDQQLPDSSDLAEHSVLSPLSGQGESINVDKPGSPSTPDPFKEKELRSLFGEHQIARVGKCLSSLNNLPNNKNTIDKITKY